MPYRAKTAFHTAGTKKKPHSGRLIGYGQILDDNDPLVKSHGDLLEPVADYLARTGNVEKATAAPGETRAAQKPKKK